MDSSARNTVDFKIANTTIGFRVQDIVLLGRTRTHAIARYDSVKTRLYTAILLLRQAHTIAEDTTMEVYSISGDAFLRRSFHLARSLGQEMLGLQIRHHHVVTLQQLIRRIQQKFVFDGSKGETMAHGRRIYRFRKRTRTEHRIITSWNCETNSD